MTDIKTLAREVAVSERTLRRALSQGAIRATRLTPRKLEVSETERRYVRRSWPLLSALTQALRTEQDVRFALLFGSASTGSDAEESDVDVLVDLRCPCFDHVVDLGTKLTAVVGRRVDVVCLQDAMSDSTFLGEILEDGRVLLDRDDVWPRLSQRVPSLLRDGRRQDILRVQTALAGIEKFLESQR